MGITQQQKSLTVYYDGSCPICHWEIGKYAKMRGGETINWIDITEGSDEELGRDLPRAQALGKFHARSSEGQLFAGGKAFAEIWIRLKALRWAGWLGQTRLGIFFLERLYRLFLRLLPILRKITGRRKIQGG